MPIPVILGALAALAGGTGLGMLKAKEAEETKSREVGREVFLKALLSGVEVPDTIIKQYFGDKNVPSFKMLGEAARFNQQRQLGAAQNLLGGESEGFGQPKPAQPQPQAPASEVAPGDPPTAPSQSWRPPLLQSAPAAASTALMEMPAIGDLAPRVAPKSPAMRPLPSTSMDVGGLKISTPGMSRESAANANRAEFGFQQQRDVANELSAASRTNMPYVELARRFDQLGLTASSPQVKDALQQYGQRQYDGALHAALSVTTGGKRAPTPTEYEGAQWQAFGQTGFGIPPAPNQGSMDQRYTSAVQAALTANPGAPFAAIDAAVRSVIGGAPSEAAVSQVAAGAKAAVERQVIAENPGIINNPNAVQAEVNKRMGFLGVTEPERARANEPAPLAATTRERTTELGVPPLRTSQLRGTQTAPGTDPASVRKAVEAEDLATATKKTQAMTEATAKGRQATAGGDLVPDTELFEKYTDTTGEPPKAGMTRGELNDAINRGEVGVMHVDKRTHRNLRTIEGIVKGYADNFAALKPVLDSGAMARILARLGAAPTPVEVLGHKFSSLLTLPALSDAQLKQAGITPEQARAAAAWVHYNNTALLTLRSIGEGERGNIAQKIVGRGEETFPNLSDNARTAQAKIDLLRKRVAVEQSAAVTYRGRDWVVGPDGKTGTVPKGAKLPAGWEYVR